MIRKDIIDFSCACGMYHGGAKTAFMDRDGTTKTITGVGSPRVYTLDGEPTTLTILKCLTRGRRLGAFTQIEGV